VPLSGIKVVDLTRILAGPFCTQLLADLGAEVVKIEPPAGGDPVRAQGAIRDGLSWYYVQFNRNKKSLTLDLYAEEGRAVLADLIRGADVLVENYRPGVLARMGFDAAACGSSIRGSSSAASTATAAPGRTPTGRRSTSSPRR
jgi:CoA:oxalate CoA-transferase